MNELICQIRESLDLNKSDFAALLGVSGATATRWEQGTRTPTGRDEIGALLRVAPPELQARLLDELGIEDVQAFAKDLLAAAGVKLVEVKR